MTTFTDSELDYLTSQQLGRLATVAPNGTPQVKPVGYQYNPELDTIDIYGMDMAASRKFRNIQANPAVAFVVDDKVADGASGVRFLEIRGSAQAATDSAISDGHLSPQLIRIWPRRVISWNTDPDHPGFKARNVSARVSSPDSN